MCSNRRYLMLCIAMRSNNIINDSKKCPKSFDKRPHCHPAHVCIVPLLYSRPAHVLFLNQPPPVGDLDPIYNGPTWSFGPTRVYPQPDHGGSSVFTGLTCGCPRTSWLRATDTDVQSVNIGIHSAWRKASDLTLWQRIVDTAALLHAALH